MSKSKKFTSKKQRKPAVVSRKTASVYKLARPLQLRTGALTKRVCSISDPFCNAAIGSKWYDDAANKTMPYAARALGVVQTNASGDGSVMVLPGFTYTAAIGAATGSISSFNLATSVIPFTFSPTGYRIVSWGVVLKNITAPLYSSGIVRIRGLSNVNGSGLTSVNSALFNDFHYDIPLQDCKEVAIVGRRFNESHHFFRPPSETNPTGNVVDWQGPGWCPLVIQVGGAPASQSVIQLEYFFNYELTWDDGDSMSLMTTPAPPSNPMISTASSKVTQAVGNVFIRGIKQAETAVIKAASSYIGGLIGGALGGPGGALAGRSAGYMLSDAMEVD